jgi:hypothetical protein
VVWGRVKWAVSHRGIQRVSVHAWICARGNQEGRNLYAAKNRRYVTLACLNVYRNDWLRIFGYRVDNGHTYIHTIIHTCIHTWLMQVHTQNSCAVFVATSHQCTVATSGTLQRIERFGIAHQDTEAGAREGQAMHTHPCTEPHTRSLVKHFVHALSAMLT